MATVRKPRYGVRYYFTGGGTTVSWFDNEDARDAVIRRELKKNEKTHEYQTIKPVQRS